MSYKTHCRRRMRRAAKQYLHDVREGLNIYANVGLHTAIFWREESVWADYLERLGEPMPWKLDLAMEEAQQAARLSRVARREVAA